MSGFSDWKPLYGADGYFYLLSQYLHAFHSIPWAVLGKVQAKTNVHTKTHHWSDDIDKYSCNCKNGETHGVLIGPHASNLISEMILTVVDQALYQDGFRYVRFIDDYQCYVDSYDRAEEFLISLREKLREYDLLLNNRKTKIISLPMGTDPSWLRRLHMVVSLYKVKGSISYRELSQYLDLALELMEDNGKNASIVYYACKLLTHLDIGERAADYYTKWFYHLCFIYPYLIPLLENVVFTRFNTSQKSIEDISGKIFSWALEKKNYEALLFSLYFACHYNFKIPEMDVSYSIDSSSCLFKIASFLYYKKEKDQNALKQLKQHARALAVDDGTFERNWLFCYEALPVSGLKGEWKPMKKAGVTFIRTGF